MEAETFWFLCYFCILHFRFKQANTALWLQYNVYYLVLSSFLDDLFVNLCSVDSTSTYYCVKITITSWRAINTTDMWCRLWFSLPIFFANLYTRFLKLLYEMFEDTKGLIITHRSMKDRQYKRKRTKGQTIFDKA